jgi:hypothetical protein
VFIAKSASASGQGVTHEIGEKSWRRFNDFLTETIKQIPDPN